MSPLWVLTLGWGTGLDARLGKGAVYVGYGAGPTLRLESPTLDLHAELRWLTLAGNTWMGRAGAGWHHPVGAWDPGLGLDLAVFHGATLRAVTSADPSLAADTAPVLQLRLDPLRFSTDAMTVEALRLQVGSGWDRGAPALSFGVTVVEAGVRF